MSQALTTLADFGIALDTERGVVADVAAVQLQARRAASSVAAAVGIRIENGDGTIDTAAARQAVSAVLGFDIDNIDDATQADHLAQARQAVRDLASTLGADILDSSGQPDPGKAQQLVNVALDLRDV